MTDLTPPPYVSDNDGKVRRIIEINDYPRRCSYCGHKIRKGDKYANFSYSGYRQSKANNVCVICFKNAAKDITATDIKNITKLRLAEEI
jgi:hypothetical protein